MVLGVGRIDHGNRSLEDSDTGSAGWARERMAMTVSSALQSAVARRLTTSPITRCGRMMDRASWVTVNSDDPAYFGGYVNENTARCPMRSGCQRDEIGTIVRNGIAASLMTRRDKTRRSPKSIAYSRRRRDAAGSRQCADKRAAYNVDLQRHLRL